MVVFRLTMVRTSKFKVLQTQENFLFQNQWKIFQGHPFFSQVSQITGNQLSFFWPLHAYCPIYVAIFYFTVHFWLQFSLVIFFLRIKCTGMFTMQAWIRIAINDGVMESYLEAMLRDPKTVRLVNTMLIYNSIQFLKI